MNKLKKNLGFQTIYQILTTIIPLITSPYISRCLGASNLGIYSYTHSIVNYFMLFAMLGFVNYGSRSIAMCKTKLEENKTFLEIYFLQLFFTLIMSILYFILIIFVKNNSIIFLLQSFYLLSCFLDVSWYFFGKEEFKTTVTRNIIIKIINVAAIFIFVKNSNDLWKYVIIMSFGTFLSQSILWGLLLKRLKFEIPKFKDVRKHLKAVLILFIPILAMSVYHIMDKTMLGLLSTYSQSGYYYNADKVINIPMGIITGLGVVMLPKMSSLKSKGEYEKSYKLLKLSISGIMCFSVAMAFGIAAISKEFVPIFFGKGFDECIVLIQILSLVILFKTISHILRTQYMIPEKKEKIFIFSVVVGSIINLIANYILIKVLNLGALGAVIGTLIAESTVCIIQVVLVNKNIKIISTILKTMIYILFGFIMFMCVRFVSLLHINLLIKVCLEIIVGGGIYLILCYLYLKLIKSELLGSIKLK